MLKNARQLIEKYALGKRVAAAVSGGEDSMALLSLLLEYAEDGKLELTAVNVDHCIRENSAADSKFVADFCKAHGVKIECRRVDIPALCAVSGRGTECEAHFARRELFAELTDSGRVDLVATAHHERDNVETVLLHLFRGAGLKGLSGMKIMSGGRLFRPFLTTPKEEISEYVRAKKIPYVTDETNADTDYDRNFIRHEILPKIAERFPAFERAVSRTAGYAADADTFIKERLDGCAICEDGDCVLLDERFVSPPYIFEALRLAGKDRDVYFAAVDSVVSLLGCRPCARVDLGDGIVAAREYGHIAFYRAQSHEICDEIPFALPSDEPLRIKLGETEAEICRAVPPYFPAEKGTLCFDADRLPQGCVWRTRREGDRFSPFGSGGRKLKEYLIDKKVPLRLRDRLMLLCLGSEVYVVGGMEISDKVKVTMASKNVLRMRICATDGNIGEFSQK